MNSHVKLKTTGKLVELVDRTEVGPRKKPRITFRVLDADGSIGVYTPKDIDEDVSDQERYAERAKIKYGECTVCKTREKVGKQLECPRTDCPKKPTKASE